MTSIRFNYGVEVVLIMIYTHMKVGIPNFKFAKGNLEFHYRTQTMLLPPVFSLDSLSLNCSMLQ